MTLALVEDAALEVVRKLDAYIGLLKTLLGDALDARRALILSFPSAPELDASASNREGMDLGELERILAGDPFATGDSAFPRMQREGWIGSVSGPPPDPRAYVDPAESGRIDTEFCMNVQLGLLAAGLTKRDPILDMLRIAASVNGGLVRLQETSYAIRHLGLSQSSEAHLPGYLLKQMKASDDFTREGKGVYRLLSFPKVSPEIVLGEGVPATRESPVDAPSEGADSG